MVTLVLPMLTIELSKLRFHAYHGLYEEEKIMGGIFEVNVSVIHHPEETPVLHIEETIDYIAVYNIVKERMNKPTALLETIATKMAGEILRKFSQAEEVSVTITKINPPIIAFEGSVGVKCVLRKSEELKS
ncbi:MAG TPA: dihydroneopterin aldolase [Panacibacter sp.]|nr:dihydroneopterin aldolase [Panacibacter sp.]